MFCMFALCKKILKHAPKQPQQIAVPNGILLSSGKCQPSSNIIQIIKGITSLNPFKLCQCWHLNLEALAQTQKMRLEPVVTKSISLKCDGLFGWTSKPLEIPQDRLWASIFASKKSQMAKRNRNGAGFHLIRQTLSTYLFNYSIQFYIFLK